MADIEGEFKVVGVEEQKPPARLLNDEAKAEITSRIAHGETLRAICRDPRMPSWNTVYTWINQDKQFAEAMDDARLLGAEAIAQECVDIADDGTNDWMEKFDKDGRSLGYFLNGEHVQRSKLRIETRLKLLAKWHPKKYGEKMDLNHGVQPDNPLASLVARLQGTSLPIRTQTIDVEETGDDE